ncbi:MAG TPA: hypothetical protein VN428_24060 [Bryobacteraceae bacterium]|nr:hypothetical protein [Bryobacteraceae bacterium]
MRAELVILTGLSLLLLGCGSKGTEPAQSAAASAPEAGRPDPMPATAQPGSAEAPGATQTSDPPAPEMVEVVIPKGTALRVRTVQALSTASNGAGDRFEAVLVSPLVQGGRMAVPRGAAVSGHVTEARPSGRLRGRGQLSVTLDSIEVDGRRHTIETGSAGRVSEAHKKRNVAFIGGGAGLGALIGGIVGGGKGAAIGAGAGAGAGTAGAAATGVKHARIGSESVLSFKLREPLRIMVPE